MPALGAAKEDKGTQIFIFRHVLLGATERRSPGPHDLTAYGEQYERFQPFHFGDEVFCFLRHDFAHIHYALWQAQSQSFPWGGLPTTQQAGTPLLALLFIELSTQFASNEDIHVLCWCVDRRVHDAGAKRRRFRECWDTGTSEECRLLSFGCPGSALPIYRSRPYLIPTTDNNRAWDSTQAPPPRQMSAGSEGACNCLCL